MSPRESELSPRRRELLGWVARLGAVTAEALAERAGCTVAVARARLLAAVRDGQLLYSRPLSPMPALYTVTRAGLRACGAVYLRPARVGPALAAHAIACARVAAALERGYPAHRILGEPELRAFEGDATVPGPSSVQAGAPLRGRHRPDLLVCPRSPAGLPVAIEVELTVKAPRRLDAIVIGWARSRHVAGVVYVASEEARVPLERAVARAAAGGRVVIVPLGEIDG